MKIDLLVCKIETNDVNIIAVNGTYYPLNGIFADGHIVVCKNNRNKIKCFDGAGYKVGQLEEILVAMKSHMVENGSHSFVLLRDRFLVNMDNVQQMHFKSNLKGVHLVEVEFQNGQVVELYRGRSEEYAVNLIYEYNEAEDSYLEKVEKLN